MHGMDSYLNKSFSLTVFTFFLVIFHSPVLTTGEGLFALTGAPLWLGTVVAERIIFVNTQHQDANDSNLGFEIERPLKTIGKASEVALENYQRGFHTKIVIYPGVYRENIKMDFKEKKERTAIIFEAKEPGTVVVSGSDVWTDWKKAPGSAAYVHSWPYKWGFMPGPSQITQTFKPIVQRREMIFVNNVPMDQVLSLNELREGTFYVSEEESQVFLDMPRGLVLSKAMVEVAIRSDLFEVTRGNNIILRGLIFQHDTTGMSTLGSAVHFLHSSNILIENCQILWNNWFGLRFTAVNNVTTSRNKANYNGGAGWVGWKIKNLFSDEDETSNNNWRGVKGNFLGWEIAGLKHHAVHDALYRRYKSIRNHTRGFWLDYDNERIKIEEACVCENLGDGMNLEASQGPITIKDSQICANQGYGIVSGSSEVTLDGNEIFDNEKSQIKHTFGSDRIVKNWETSKTLKVHGDNWTLKDNIITADSNALLLDFPGSAEFLGSLVLEGNFWGKINNSDLFKVDKKSMPLSEWKLITNQEESKAPVESTNIHIKTSSRSCP